MLRKLSQRINNEEKGFTLIELLVVILIIGILAAIALPAFLGQQTKGQDAEAKSNARNLESQIESCFANTQDYSQCQANADGTIGSSTDPTGLPIGTNPGQVTTSGLAQNSYTITAVSKAGAGDTFTITKTNGGAAIRTCSQHGKGACKASADSQGNFW